jgi:hypothetical protein
MVNVEPYVTVTGDDGALPKPPPAAKVMFWMLLAHTAYNVTLLEMMNVVATER